MAFADEVAAHSKRPGIPCSINVFLSGLDADERAEIEEALADRSLQSGAIIAALKARGHDVTYSQQWGRHRGGRCSCG